MKTTRRRLLAGIAALSALSVAPKAAEAMIRQPFETWHLVPTIDGGVNIVDSVTGSVFIGAPTDAMLDALSVVAEARVEGYERGRTIESARQESRAQVTRNGVGDSTATWNPPIEANNSDGYTLTIENRGPQGFAMLVDRSFEAEILMSAGEPLRIEPNTIVPIFGRVVPASEV